MVLSIARLFFLILLLIFLFFGWFILRASVATETTPQPTIAPVQNTEMPIREKVLASTVGVTQEAIRTAIAPHSPSERIHVHANCANESDVPLQVPYVPGQTEDDLTSPEPLQATPPTVFYDSPEATDPMNTHAYMNATFGSNLRHPEQMMESYPKRTMQNSIHAGIASHERASTGSRAARYSEEMIQNGGVMQDGILANDIQNSGNGFGLSYSLL